MEPVSFLGKLPCNLVIFTTTPQKNDSQRINAGLSLPTAACQKAPCRQLQPPQCLQISMHPKCPARAHTRKRAMLPFVLEIESLT